MYDILAAIDTDKSGAQGQARTITETPLVEGSARVTLFHGFTDNPEGTTVNQIGAVRRAREILEDAGMEVRLKGDSGDPAKSILAIAEEIDADLITLAGRKHTPAGKVLFGSVTQSVLLNTDRPVLVCSAEEK